MPVASAAVVGRPIQNRNSNGTLYLGLITTGLIAVFLGLTFNRYLPINEGWFHYYTQDRHGGKLPYRDFYFFGQPVPLYISWVFGGTHLINLRVFGLVERVAITAMLYFLLSREFSPMASFWATLLSMTLLATYRSDSLFSSLYDSLFFLAAGMIFVYQTHARPKSAWLALAAGASASLSFFTKQSTGFFVTLALAILIVWLTSTLGQAMRTLVFFSVGWCLAATPVVGWILANHLWKPYVQQVFIGAVASKGKFDTLLFQTLRMSAPIITIYAIVMLMVLAGVALDRRLLVWSASGKTRGLTPVQMGCASVLVLAAILLPLYFQPNKDSVEWLYEFTLRSCTIAFVAMAAIAGLFAFRWAQSLTAPARPVITILVVAGFAWAYGSQLSYRAEQHSIVLGIALFAAAAYDQLGVRPGKALRGMVATLCLFWIALNAWKKGGDAYDWNGWHSNVSLASAISHYPQLAGFRLDQSEITMLDTILDDISRTAKPNEPIFTFPTIPMFNYITGHPQPTFCPVHYWDVCPDEVAEADVTRLREAKPAVIVSLELDEWVWLDGEATFRQGRKSAARDLHRIIEDWTSSGEYRLLRSFPTPGYHMPVKVWARVH